MENKAIHSDDQNSVTSDSANETSKADALIIDKKNKKSKRLIWLVWILAIFVHF